MRQFQPGAMIVTEEADNTTSVNNSFEFSASPDLYSDQRLSLNSALNVLYTFSCQFLHQVAENDPTTRIRDEIS